MPRSTPRNFLASSRRNGLRIILCSTRRPPGLQRHYAMETAAMAQPNSLLRTFCRDGESALAQTIFDSQEPLLATGRAFATQETPDASTVRKCPAHSSDSRFQGAAGLRSARIMAQVDRACRDSRRTQLCTCKEQVNCNGCPSNKLIALTRPALMHRQNHATFLAVR